MTETPSRTLDPTRDVALLTADLIDMESVSGNEKEVADAVEAALRALPHLEVVRDGDSVMARTSWAAPSGSSLPGTWTPSRCPPFPAPAAPCPPPGTGTSCTAGAPQT